LKRLEYWIIGIILFLFFSIYGVILGAPISFAVVVGGSMYPTLKTGDICLGVSTHITSIQMGDIGIYESRKGLIVHRVISTNDTSNIYIFKGDNNPQPDPPVSKDKILYKVLLRIPLEIWVPFFSLLVFTTYTVLHRRIQEYSIILWIIILILVIYMTTETILMGEELNTYNIKPIEKITGKRQDIGDTHYIRFPYKLTRYECIGNCTLVNPYTIEITGDGILTVTTPTKPEVNITYTITS